MAETLPAETLDTNLAPNAAPNLDSELDAALNKSFSGARPQVDAPIKEKSPIEESKKQVEQIEQNTKPEVKSEEVKKPVEIEKPLLTHDEIEKTDPKKQDSWTALKNNNKRSHRVIEQKDQEITKLKATLADKISASQKELEAIRGEKSELEKYRAMVDIQADPEFISKYDQPIEKAVSGIKDMIKSLGVTQETVETIDFKDPARLETIIDLISQNKDRFTAGKIERKIKEYLDLADKRNETLEDQKKNYKETLEQKKKESFAKGAESEGKMIKHLQLKASEMDKDGKPLIPFLNRIEPKENATPAEIQQVENHNGLVEVMSKKLESVLKMKEPEQQAEIAIAAVASHYLMAELRATREELRKSKEELQKISVVSTETPTRKPATVSKNGNGEYVDTEKAINTYFSRNR